MTDQKEVTVEQYLVNQTVDNLTKANANQALQIANLQAQISYLNLRLNPQSENVSPALDEPELEPDLEVLDIEH